MTYEGKGRPNIPLSDPERVVDATAPVPERLSGSMR
jgi:hypothetical protein